jgi:ribonucleoside-diphosphate reductase subunit M1
MYYLRTKPAANAIQFTVDAQKARYGTRVVPRPFGADKDSKAESLEEQKMMCSLLNKDECLMCSS